MILTSIVLGTVSGTVLKQIIMEKVINHLKSIAYNDYKNAEKLAIMELSD